MDDIGTGEAYEPMNYVIDTDKDGKDYMYSWVRALSLMLWMRAVPVDGIFSYVHLLDFIVNGIDCFLLPGPRERDERVSRPSCRPRGLRTFARRR